MTREESLKSESRSSLDVEWGRLKGLIPCVEKGSGRIEGIERDIYALIDGKLTCEEIVARQDLSTDSAVLIFLRFERDGIIHCFELSEKLRDVKFEKSEAEKELMFLEREKIKMREKITLLGGEILACKSETADSFGDIVALKERVSQSDEHLDSLDEEQKEAIESVDRLVTSQKDMARFKKDVLKSTDVLKEEVLYLEDEKWSAMKSIRELETKIEELVQLKESYLPKVSAYRSVVREAYKTLREARARADKAIKGI